MTTSSPRRRIHVCGRRGLSVKQIAGDILLAAVILLVLMIAMGLMSDYDTEALNRQALKEAQRMARAERMAREREMHALARRAEYMTGFKGEK
jgi:hypothetical protein